MIIKATLDDLSVRGRGILRSEGLIPLLKSGVAFLVGFLFRYETYYLYEHTMKERNEADFLPKVKDFTVRMVYTNEQANELMRNGFDLSSFSIYSRRRLDKGAIALCIFVGQDLAHVGLMALTEEAKRPLDPHPYHVDFANGQACTGGTVTAPKYRGKGLMVYGYYKRFEYLRGRGIATTRNVVNTGNIASQRAHARFGPRICARARYLKILWWQSWKDTPLNPTGCQDWPPC